MKLPLDKWWFNGIIVFMEVNFMRDMSNNLYPIEYKRKWTVMSNYLIQGKQNMTLQEARLLRLCITQIARGDKDLKTYTININELANYLNIKNQTLFRDIKKICKNLCQRIVEINSADGEWEIFHWVSCAKYHNGAVTIKISDELKPYVLELNSFFSKIRLDSILAVDSYYAIRLYELLQMQKGITGKNRLTFSIENLRVFFDCTEKFERISSFKEKVIEKAIEEINLKTDINVEIEYIKTAKTVTDITFFVKEKDINKAKEEEKEQPTGEEIDLDDLIEQLQDIIEEKLKIKEYKAILEAANNNIELIRAKYQIAKKQRKIDNLVGWMMKAIQEEYSEPVEKKKVASFNNIEGRQYDYNELERALLKH